MLIVPTMPLIADPRSDTRSLFGVSRSHCRVTTRVRGERGGTTGVLDRRAGIRRVKEGGTLACIWAEKHTGTRPVNAEDTSGARDRAKGHEYMYI